MTHTIQTLPRVDPMMVRRFDPGENGWAHFRDKVLLMTGFEFDVEEIGMAASRLPFDEDVIDQSNSVFQLTTAMMLSRNKDFGIAVFTSRRWRNHRWVRKEGDEHDMEWPTPESPLLFIGNPILIFNTQAGVEVYREKSYLIKSGCQLQAELDSTL